MRKVEMNKWQTYRLHSLGPVGYSAKTLYEIIFEIIIDCI